MNTEAKSTIVLATNTSDPALELRCVEHFAGSSGFSSVMFVQYRGFSALRSFYFSEHSFQTALKALRRMDKELQGEACLNEDYEHNQFLRFTLDSRGHVCVSGQLVLLDGSSNRLSFEFDTDQTCLTPLIRSLDTFNQ